MLIFPNEPESRHRYCLWTHGAARFLWLLLAIAIGAASWGWGDLNNHRLVVLTLLIILASHLLRALGSASWLSWMAMLVPRQLRGRYFGVRNSASSFTQLLCVPLGWFGCKFLSRRTRTRLRTGFVL